MTTTLTASATWTLTEFAEGNQQQRTINLPQRTLIVGRTTDADVCIPSNSVSKNHARLSFEQNQMTVEDLGSTNGTYVNGNTVKCSVVAAGDLLQFANALYRVGQCKPQEQCGTMEEGILPWAQTLLLFDRLLTDRAVIPFFQPIITMDRQRTPAYELLARSNMEGLTNPAAMFGAAERLGQQATLSELMRDEGIRVASHSAQNASEFFLNTHPCEVVNPRLTDSLHALRAAFPDTRITIEIHESAITRPEAIRDFRTVLLALDMQLSYDDFGAGQGRLLELGEVPPDVLKFDMGLIRDIDSAPATRQEMLSTLVRLSIDLGATPLAEGVETEAEHAVCQQMGFQLGQGFLYGRPAPF